MRLLTILFFFFQLQIQHFFFIYGIESYVCDEQWTERNGNCYRAMGVCLSHKDAIEKCIEYGGHLISIGSVDEQVVLNDLEKSHKTWIGLEKNNREWIWLDNLKFTYSNWAKNEPKNNIFKATHVINEPKKGWRNVGDKDCSWVVCKYKPINRYVKRCINAIGKPGVQSCYSEVTPEADRHTYEVISRECNKSAIMFLPSNHISLENYLVSVDGGKKYYCINDIYMKSGKEYAEPFVAFHVPREYCWQQLSSHMLYIEGIDEAKFLHKLLFEPEGFRQYVVENVPIAPIPENEIVRIAESNLSAQFFPRRFSAHFLIHPYQIHVSFCHEGWTSLPTSCVRYFPMRVTYAEAKRFCGSMESAHLAYSTKVEEERTIQFMVAKETNETFWVGVRATNSGYLYDDNTIMFPIYDKPFSVSYRVHKLGQISNDTNCFVDGFRLGWSAENCSTLHPFVCQYHLGIVGNKALITSKRFVCKNTIRKRSESPPMPDSEYAIKTENEVRRIHFSKSFCDVGMIELKDKICYEFVRTPKSFHDAAEHCETYGAMIATFTKLADLKDIQAKLPSDAEFWAGAKRYDATWLWLDNLHPVHLAWENYEPKFSKPEYSCAVVRPNGRWRSELCNKKLPFLCALNMMHRCRKGFIFRRKKCFKFIKKRVNVTTAEEICKFYGSYTAIISSEDETVFLAEIAGKEQYWINLYRYNTTWLWNRRARISYSNWKTYSKSSESDKNRNYAVGDINGWTAVNGNHKANILCSYESESLLYDTSSLFSPNKIKKIGKKMDTISADNFSLVVGVCAASVFILTTALAWYFTQGLGVNIYEISRTLKTPKTVDADKPGPSKPHLAGGIELPKLFDGSELVSAIEDKEKGTEVAETEEKDKEEKVEEKKESEDKTKTQQTETKKSETPENLEGPTEKLKSEDVVA